MKSYIPSSAWLTESKSKNVLVALFWDGCMRMMVCLPACKSLESDIGIMVMRNKYQFQVDLAVRTLRAKHN